MSQATFFFVPLACSPTPNGRQVGSQKKSSVGGSLFDQFDPYQLLIENDGELGSFAAVWSGRID